MNTDYSVVIPAFNAGAFLAEAVQSVLSQTILPSHIVIVDDGSTDNTAEIARSLGPGIELIRTENRGAGPATTTGIEHVSTPVVALLDADDVWVLDKMEQQLGCLLNPTLKLDAVIGKMTSFGATHIKDSDHESSGWHRSTLTMWTEKFRLVGAVEQMPNGYGEMVDWFSRARELGMAFHLLPDSVAMRRIHENSLSFRGGAGRDSDYLQTAIRALMRKKLLKQ
jgi:glycosyltransferase involved in cell wall biosynthesis